MEHIKKHPVLYDFVENFPLADVKQEVTLIDIGTPSARQYMRAGWSGDEGSGNSTFVWGLGEKSVLGFFLYESRDIQVAFRCSPVRFPGAPAQVISIAVNGKELERVTLKPRSEEYQIVLPSHTVAAGENRLEFRYTYARAPAEVIRGSGDLRRLAVAWDYIRLGTGVARAQSEARVKDEGSVVYIPFGAQMDYYLRLSEESFLMFDGLTFTENAEGRLRITMRPEGKKEHVVGDFSTSEGFQVVPLASDLSQIVRVTFQADSVRRHSYASGGVSLNRPMIRTKSALKTALPVSSSRRAPSSVGVRRPNVIIYLIDALRADHLGCYGYEKPVSPNVDALARDAVLFEKAIAQAPYTRPSTASLFTGLSPETHRVKRRNDSLPAEATTLAEMLRSVGYHTAAIMANGNTSKTFGFDQGFDDFVDLTDREKAIARASRLHNDHKELVSHDFSSHVNEFIYEWLEKQRTEQPFFLYVHRVEPHAPYDPPSRFRERFAPAVRESEMRSEANVLMANLLGASAHRTNRPANIRLGSIPWMRLLYVEKIPVTETLIQDMVALYDAEIAFTDHAFGSFTKELRQRDLYDESLIILLSDHGEEFYEHGSWQHGASLYSEVLNIPLIVKFPSSSGIGDKRSPQLAQHIDILPTIADYLGLDVPAYIEGDSLLPIFSSVEAEGQSRTVFSSLDTGRHQGASVIKGPWKLIRYRTPESSTQLFNHEKDPNDLLDLSSQHPILAGYLSALIRAYEQKGARRLKPGRAVIDEELRERLKALGYVR